MDDEAIKQLGRNDKIYYVHNKYNSHLFTEQDINNFLEFYRVSFPEATILPKMHILEDHVIPWFQRWHMGFGIMGEQGAESIHAHLMKLERIYQGIANDVERLKYIFKEHMLESAPSLVSLRPPPKKRTSTT